jgi:branched-chain amino acid aminotransferase
VARCFRRDDHDPGLLPGCAYQRGDYVPIAQAGIPLTDWGFLRSDATYDVVTAWDGAFFRLDAHLDRFFASCGRFRLDPGRGREDVAGSWRNACAAPGCAMRTWR